MFNRTLHYDVNRAPVADDVRVSSRDKYAALLTSICSLHDVIDKFKAADVDPTEYACLKGIVIFKTS